jgi:hypothetical protein
LELQTYLTTLVSTFTFEPTAESEDMRRESCVVMVPTIQGMRNEGSFLPLKVGLV